MKNNLNVIKYNPNIKSVIFNKIHTCLSQTIALNAQKASIKKLMERGLTNILIHPS